MGDWFSMEQQSLYIQQTLVAEAARRRLSALVPQVSLRVRAARFLVALAATLAPTTVERQVGQRAAAPAECERPLVRPLGS